MRYLVNHTTTYAYSSPASLSHNELMLQPRQTFSQTVTEAHLEVTPAPQHFHFHTDYFGNIVHHFMVQHPHSDLTISASSIVTTSQPFHPDAATTESWEETAILLRATQKQPDVLNACRYLFASLFIPLSEEMRQYALPSFPAGRPLLEASIDLIKRIYIDFSYDKKASTIETPVEQVLRERKGVCQDFAHLAISCLRSLGLAARYVSGYIETLPPEGKPKLVGADASHAWLSIFVPNFGWVDLDPTNNQAANDTYITVAWGRDYSDVAPVKGVVMGGGKHTLSVTVDISPLQAEDSTTCPGA